MPDPVGVLLEKLNSSLSFLASSRAGLAYDSFRERFPELREFNLPTPFGRVKTPNIKVPEFRPASLDPRQLEVLKAALGTDLAQIVALVPLIGDIIADIVEDTYAEKIRDSTTDEEYKRYLKYDKLGPSTIAAVRTFMVPSLRRKL